MMNEVTLRMHKVPLEGCTALKGCVYMYEYGLVCKKSEHSLDIQTHTLTPEVSHRPMHHYAEVVE